MIQRFVLVVGGVGGGGESSGQLVQVAITLDLASHLTDSGQCGMVVSTKQSMVGLVGFGLANPLGAI
jgi:hypothetical protein